jgi:hypothetical protein
MSIAIVLNAVYHAMKVYGGAYIAIAFTSQELLKNSDAHESLNT